MLRLTLPLALTCALAAHAQGECDDSFLECKDDCVVEFGGSVRVEMKKRYDKCMKKCIKVVNRCTERALETKNNALDHDALDGTVTSDQVDKDNLPTRTAGKKKRAPEPSAEDDAADEPRRPKEALREEELPRSSRTTLKVEDSPPPPKPAAREDSSREEPVARREEPPARREEPPPRREEPPKKAARLDEDLRDDGPRAEAPKKRVEEEPPPPPKKREERPKEPPKKKEEDHDDLRFY